MTHAARAVEAAPNAGDRVSNRSLTLTKEDERPAYLIIAAEIAKEFKFKKNSKSSEICDVVNRAISKGRCFNAKGRFSLMRLELCRDRTSPNFDKIALHIRQTGQTIVNRGLPFHSADLFRSASR